MKTIPILPEEPATCASSALVALQVLDCSMAPELDITHIVVIDRTGRLSEGSLVLVEINEHLLIRRWQSLDNGLGNGLGNEKIQLVPLNRLWNTITCAKADVQVKGVVVQRSGRRRKDRKRYA